MTGEILKEGERISETYPKSFKELVSFVKNLLLEKQGEFHKEFPSELGMQLPKITDEECESITKVIIANNTRFLYDFFDSQRIFIEIVKKGEIWYYEDGEIPWNSSSFSSRKAAEKAGFEMAFKRLEEEGNL